MITIANAQIYSIKGEIAYEIEYSQGTKVRAVESKDNFIRKEYLNNGNWELIGKPYVVKHNKLRNAEKIKKEVLEFIKK